MHGFDDCNQLTRTLGGFSETVIVQAVLEKVHCSAAYNFIWLGFPGCCYFNWVKVFCNTDVLNYFTISFAPLFLYISIYISHNCVRNTLIYSVPTYKQQAIPALVQHA